MKTHRIASWLFGLAAIGLGSIVPAWPFGEFGHQVVGALAEDLLTPKAKAQVRSLLGPAGGPPTLAAASTWADEIKTLRPATRSWHYITLQIGDPRPDPSRADTPNAVTALERQLAVLARPDADRYAREEALKWAVHLVGDLHQPLHAGEDRDKGGNLVQVRVNRRTYNLHAVWDHVLLDRLRMPMDSVKARLEREIAADPGWAGRNAQGTPAGWALETHSLALSCYQLRGRPLPKGRKVQLDREYVRAATLVSLGQLKRAGARLAFALNRALDPQGPPIVLPSAPGGAPAAETWFAQAVPVDAESQGEDAAPSAEKTAAGGEKASGSTARTPGLAGKPPDEPRGSEGKRSRTADKPPVPGRSGRGTAPARYAWSVNSKVYHYSGCADVKRIRKQNLETSDTPPMGKRLHAGCPLP